MKLLVSPRNEKHKMQWVIELIDDEKDRKVKLCDLNLSQSSLTNKFDIVASLIHDLNNTVPEFVYWYSNLLKTYKSSNYNSEIILNEVPNFIEIAEKYISAKNINFEEFVDYNKASRTSIIFTAEDIKSIAITSFCLKLYSVFSYDETMKLTDNIHKNIYSEFIKPCFNAGTTSKIYQIMKSRTYRSSITDRYMWDLIKLMVLETPESYALVLFNFLMTNLISSLDVCTNPIPFIVSITDDSIRWMMITIYKDKIIYGEAFGDSDDIYGSSLSKDSLYIYCCNDVIGKAAKAGMTILENEYNINSNEFFEVRDRLDKISKLNSIMKCITLPIASEVLEIPYKYLLTAPPKHIMLLSIFMHHLAKDILSERFPVLMDFLISVPDQIDSSVFRSSYKVKNAEFVINDSESTPLFGLNATELKFNIMSCICGILSVSKKSAISIVDGSKLPKINYSDLESDSVIFFSELYSHKLKPYFEKMREKAENYF